MQSLHPLKGLLQVQLASDASAVLHLPYVLETLSAEHLQQSPHTQKWCTRVNSLLHSRDLGARWSGLCLALQTSVHSKSLMMEYAASWIGVALPLLSKDEPVPNVKAAIRLLRQILSSAMEVAEYQRHICLPNVPKFSAALLSLSDKHPEQEVKLLVLNTLTHLVPLFPTLHRGLHQLLSSTTLRFLNGSTPRPTPTALVHGASRLYSALHVTGGKVGAANVWRKALDDTLGFTWNALASMRRTSQPMARGQGLPQLSSADPIVSVPLNLDRLRAGVRILCDLLRSPTSRPVTVPLGPLVQFCLAMLGCTPEEKPTEGHVDSSTRAMELAVIPSIWSGSCELLEALAGSAHCHLLPYLPQLASHLAYHLEQQHTASERLSFLKATRALLTTCPHLHDPITASRLARAVAPSLAVLLSTKSQAQEGAGTTASKARNRKGKKRARGYEGDEVFNVTAKVICNSKVDGDVLLASIDVVRLVLRNPHLPSAVRSLLSRILLAIYVSLPLMQASLVSADLSLHGTVHEKIRVVCVEQASGTSNVLSKSLGLVVSNVSSGQQGTNEDIILRDVDLLLHPRVPPLVRSLPHLEMLSLFREEEGEEELGMRKALGLASADETLSTLSSNSQRPGAPPELVDAPSVPALGRTEAVANSSVSGQFPTPIRHPQIQISPAATVAQPIASYPATMLLHAVSTTSTAHIAAASNQEKIDTLNGQGPPLVSHPTLPVGTTPTAASYPSVIQPPIAGPSTAPLTASTPEPRSQPGMSMPMDEDDEDEPMPAINMDSDSDGDS
ncbi:hypothetical protein FOMPIDRAFT_1046630 [Fomitopsis schrenkii]|uniref:Pre-rRNA-processing protein RIX1 n=1 Tax=Fomitopsis schrenkii TaxID=2126942 RepID=S8FQQ1_FOMSC|nr:hypothetical protein FOMPIDRAFT_1046630 [Fomitopsis schrenkii]